MNILIGIILTVHVITCVLLILIIMMQRPRSEGLGTAFGGGVTDTLFGSSTGNVLTKITTWLAVIFFISTISLAYLYSHRVPTSKLGEKLKATSKTEVKESTTNHVESAKPLPEAPEATKPTPPATPSSTPAESSPATPPNKPVK